MAGLNKEIWLSRLEMNEWFADNAFMQDAVNLDTFVDNDTINFARQGTFLRRTYKRTLPIHCPHLFSALILPARLF